METSSVALAQKPFLVKRAPCSVAESILQMALLRLHPGTKIKVPSLVSWKTKRIQLQGGRLWFNFLKKTHF